MGTRTFGLGLNWCSSTASFSSTFPSQRLERTQLQSLLKKPETESGRGWGLRRRRIVLETDARDCGSFCRLVARPRVGSRPLRRCALLSGRMTPNFFPRLLNRLSIRAAIIVPVKRSRHPTTAAGEAGVIAGQHVHRRREIVAKDHPHLFCNPTTQQISFISPFCRREPSDLAPLITTISPERLNSPW